MEQNDPLDELVLDEIVSLNAADLDIEQLERRLELALGWISIGDRPNDGCTCNNQCGCYGTNCGCHGDCGFNCPGNCSAQCGNNCSALWCTMDCDSLG